jgi:hypothetical protein
VAAERYSWRTIAGRTVDCYRAAGRQEQALLAGRVTVPPLRLQVPDGNLLTGSS